MVQVSQDEKSGSSAHKHIFCPSWSPKGRTIDKLHKLHTECRFRITGFGQGVDTALPPPERSGTQRDRTSGLYKIRRKESLFDQLVTAITVRAPLLQGRQSVGVLAYSRCSWQRHSLPTTTPLDCRQPSPEPKVSQLLQSGLSATRVLSKGTSIAFCWPRDARDKRNRQSKGRTRNHIRPSLKTNSFYVFVLGRNICLLPYCKLRQDRVARLIKSGINTVESRTGAVALVSRWRLTVLSRRRLNPV